ncbi:MAG: (2Fe-2S)-binding protein [Candidatus Caldarchaeum sp.]|nr:(2Fe-2S)-binding protein [Candidatus Caldarchaeum sp.]
MKVEFVLNGRAVSAELKGNERLMDLLWKLGIRSVKEGCSTGDCGTCNVLVDGRLVNSCMMLAVQARNKSVVTVEGISQNEELHPIQEALIEYTASQCGYCIPGIVVTAKYILEKYPQADENTVRQILIATICRCGGYTRIVDAINSVIASSRR